MSGNADLAGATLGRLAEWGVREVVVCAGGRNAPLVTALLAAGESGPFRLWRHFDERAAAYFALGRALARGEPVAVVTTSGTAAAELLPAAVEACYAGVPLVLVTADRPARFRGSGAPQAIEQAGLFGPYAPAAVDAETPADLEGAIDWSGDEPLHLNLCFEEPEAGGGDGARLAEGEKGEARRGGGGEDANDDPAGDSDEGWKVGREGDDLGDFLAGADRPVVLLGDLPTDWREPVAAFLVDLGAPVWAEATSGLRECEVLRDRLIRTESRVAALEPRQVLRVGGVPSLRYWRDLENRPDIEVMSVARRAFAGLARPSRLRVTERFDPPPRGVQQGWTRGSTLSTRSGVEELERALTVHPHSEPAAVRALSEIIPAEALVFLGNSLPIREWNLAATVERAHPRCVANRGANGIDGEVATFLGRSEGEREAWAILGDLTALYDLNAPALLGQLSAGLRRIAVLNNGGGRIFSRLPALAGLAAEEKRVSENRHGCSFEGWAALWNLDYAAWCPGETLPRLDDGAAVLEVRIDEEATEAFWREWESAR